MTEAMIISEVFYDITKRRTFFKSLDDRLDMQKVVYLLYEFGVSCGNFPFRWYKHGPYSQQLQNVMIANDVNNEDTVSFSENCKEAVSKVKKMLGIPHDGYTDSYWLEALGSILYLKKYIRPEDDSADTLNKLKDLTSHLHNEELNEKAYNALADIGLIE